MIKKEMWHAVIRTVVYGMSKDYLKNKKWTTAYLSPWPQERKKNRQKNQAIYHAQEHQRSQHMKEIPEKQHYIMPLAAINLHLMSR